MLTDLFNWKSNKVTLKDVKLMTFAEESGKGKAGIFVKGEVLARRNSSINTPAPITPSRTNA